MSTLPKNDPVENDGRLLEELVLGGMAPADVQVRELPDLGAVQVKIRDGGAPAVELLLAPAVALEMALRITRAAMRVAIRGPVMSTITSVEPQQIDVRPEMGGVLIEVVDRNGDGFSTIFDVQAALELVLRIAGTIAKLRGWGGVP